jgi:PAS domain-containing protein
VTSRAAAGAQPPEERAYARNLYRFIRLILGPSTSDNAIARRWQMDPGMFNDLKHGRVAVPRLERLCRLAEVLGVNEHYVFAAGMGVPAHRLVDLLGRQDVSAAVDALVNATARTAAKLEVTEAALAENRELLQKVSSDLELRDAQLHALLEQLLVAVLTLDTHGNLIHVNRIGRELFGVKKVGAPLPLPLVMSETVFLDLDGKPFDATQLPSYRALRDQSVRKGVFSVHRKGKPGRLVAATATPVRAGKRFIGVISVLRDVEDILTAVGGIGVDLPNHPRYVKREEPRRDDGRDGTGAPRRRRKPAP